MLEPDLMEALVGNMVVIISLDEVHTWLGEVHLYYELTIGGRSAGSH